MFAEWGSHGWPEIGNCISLMTRRYRLFVAATALRQANIGIAMGRCGTVLAREASSMVITDDNFATIVKAVRQGRIIYANMRKSISYLLTAGLASVICVAGGVLMQIGLPLTPLQLLWLNLIMHVFPGVGIVLQPGDGDIMSKAPRSKAEQLLSPEIKHQIVVRSVVVAVAVLCSMQMLPLLAIPAAKTTTIGFATLSVALLLQALSLACNGQRMTATRQIINWPMTINITASFTLLLAAIYVPCLQTILQTQILEPREILVVAALSFVDRDRFVLGFVQTSSVRLICRQGQKQFLCKAPGTKTSLVWSVTMNLCKFWRDSLAMKSSDTGFSIWHHFLIGLFLSKSYCPNSRIARLQRP